MKDQLASEVPNFESIEDEEKRIRASGLCLCGAPVAIVPFGHATLCEQCRTNLLTGGLAA